MITALARLVTVIALVIGAASIVCIVIAGCCKEGSESYQFFVNLAGKCRVILMLTIPLWVIAIIITITN